MAGIIIADTIQSGSDFIRLNSASQTVATINVRGIYANTGNLLIAANGTIGVAAVPNTAITGTITSPQIANSAITAAKLGISGAVIQTQIKNSLTLASTSSTSFVELSSDYRVSITPRFNNSRMIITYHLPINSYGPDMATIVHFKPFKRIGGTNSDVTGFGGSFNGNLGNRTSTMGAKRYAATDQNDADVVSLVTYDDVSSTDTVEYGFFWKRETGGTSTNYFAHSFNNAASYGWMAPVTIIVQEIAV